MSGMLQHHDTYGEIVERHQLEARRWAESERLGRLARAARQRQAAHRQAHHHSVRAYARALRMHVRGMAAPITVRMHHRA